MRSEEVSKVIYYAKKGMETGASPDVLRRIERVRLAERFGWSLDYIDSLDPFDIADIRGVVDGDVKTRKR